MGGGVLSQFRERTGFCEVAFKSSGARSKALTDKHRPAAKWKLPKSKANTFYNHSPKRYFENPPQDERQ